MVTRSITPEYEAAHTDSVFYIQKNAGLLSIAGPDRVDFLQRQTTNDMRSLQSGQVLLSVLTSPAARILDVFYIFKEEIAQPIEVEPSESIGILPLPGNGADTFRYLKSRIFFMDKVTITDRSNEYIQIDLFGPNASVHLQELGQINFSGTQSLAKLSGSAFEIYVLKQNPKIGAGYRLIAPVQFSNRLRETLKGLSIPEINEDMMELLRVEAGIPAGGHELTEDYTPLETGLRTAVADKKGCYTGQEIIARQITFEKVTQALCGLKFADGYPDTKAIIANEKLAGKLTSFVESPRFGNIGLAVIKRPFVAPGTSVQLGKCLALVSEIPFK